MDAKHSSDLSFEIHDGEMAFLTGRSGAGKSTVLKLIALLERPTRGQVLVNGDNTAKLPRGGCRCFAAAWVWCSRITGC